MSGWYFYQPRPYERRYLVFRSRGAFDAGARHAVAEVHRLREGWWEAMVPGVPARGLEPRFAHAATREAAVTAVMEDDGHA